MERRVRDGGVEGELEVFDFVHSVLLAVSVHPCRDNT